MTEDDWCYLTSRKCLKEYKQYKRFGFGTRFMAWCCMDDKAWRLLRNTGVGGSDVAAVMGISPWKTPMQVWLEKTGREESPDLSHSEPVYWGTVNEETIARRFAEDHPTIKVRKINATLIDSEHEWRHANLDRMLITPDGKPEVLEIKTAAAYKADDWADGVPVYYQTQVMMYLLVTGWETAHVAVLIGGNDYREYTVERDEEDIQAVAKAVDSFWCDYVQKDVMPEVIGTAGELGSLAQLTPDAEGIRDEGANSELDKLLSDYDDACFSAKVANETKTRLAAKIAQAIGDDRGIQTDIYRATFVRSKRKSLDQQALKREMPDVYAKYVTEKVVNGGVRLKELS